MRMPSSACSVSRIAPRTEVSASRFCGGSLPEASGGTETATRCAAARLRRRDDRLYVCGDTVVDFDRDHVGPCLLDRFLEVHLPAVELHPASRLDRIDDLLGGHGPEQPAVLARGVRDREDGLGEERGC